MRRVSLPISGLEYMFRANVCDHCAHRTPVVGERGERDCQATCDQYRALPSLYTAASRLDPMIANVSEALKHQMPVTGGAVNWPARRRQKVIGLVRRYLDI
jgi:hypothetical protein